MIVLPVDRALSIYGALADRSETKGARKRLSEHLMKKYIAGEKDEHRLTVEGLVLPSQSRSGNSTHKVSHPKRDLSLQGFPLLSQGSCAASFSPSAACTASVLVGFCFGWSAFFTCVGIIGCTWLAIIEACSLGCVLIGPMGGLLLGIVR